MEGGSTGGSSAAGTNSPPESKLASGSRKSPTQKSSKRGPRKLNKIGTRYKTAAELITTVSWLNRANRDRIAWVIRNFTDNGWTAREIQAAAELTPLPARGVSRPSGLLASRLASKHLVFDTPDKRAHLVAMWEDSRHAEQERHQEHVAPQQGPGRLSVRHLMAEAVRRVNEIAAGPIDDADCFVIPVETAPEPVALEDLGHELVLASRAEAAKDHRVILNALESGMPELDARRLYTHWLVDQALAAQRRAELTPAF
jgi:hypothetical protein